MERHTSRGVVLLLALSIALGGCALLSRTTERERQIEQMIADAQTPDDHEAIAAWYEKEAGAARTKQIEHEKMREAYKKKSRPGRNNGSGSVAHCTAIAGQFEHLAQEYEALAQEHHAMATSAMNSPDQARN